MATTHWEAFLEVPTLLMKDWPSIVFHGVICKIDKMLKDATRGSQEQNMIIPFLVDGVAYTMRQDYGFALIKQGNNIPKSVY